MNNDRGKLIHRECANQVRDFTGLRYGKITPTDIDAFLDFQNKAFVLIEAKYRLAKVPVGQMLAIERMCDAWQKAGIETLGIIGRHESMGDIDFANLTVIQYRRRGKWKFPARRFTAKEMIDLFVDFATNKGGTK